MTPSDEREPAPGAGDLRPGDEAPPQEPSAGENVCPACGGSGVRDGERCSDCRGTGRVTEGVGGG